MYYDELPIWGLIGRVENREETDDPKDYKYFLYKHIHFDILYNKDRVIEITARTDPHSVLDLTEDKEVNAEFTYTAKWKQTDIPSLLISSSIKFVSVINKLMTKS
ncbi:transmembrane 9 superfamily member 3 [Nicotiana attenuata]|uniref:Transmembrane 9 superfamily member n=1 Tax=Nicotiana attenuata TaxID=49451 RepID=A0A1J6IQ40_NICAT|nr:transmembrane 9 superfamily member 3 [Nicotiana attenuata]